MLELAKENILKYISIRWAFNILLTQCVRLQL